jgi:hypothetical protein
MPSADQVPVKSSHSRDALAQVGCPDRRIDPALHYVLFALSNFHITPEIGAIPF